MNRLRGFGRFWWDFVIGDDWRLALGGALALGPTALVAGKGLSAWWVAPTVIVVVLVFSVVRAGHTYAGKTAAKGPSRRR
jgi:hypothetical protein